MTAAGASTSLTSRINGMTTHTHTHTHLTSRLAPRARLTVDVPTWAFWPAGIFLRRKKRCAGVVGTRTDWVLKGEEGGMTTPLLQYVARFDGGISSQEYVYDK